MRYRWEELEDVIERVEEDRLLRALEELEQREGYVKRRFFVVQRTARYLEFLGEVAVGAGVGVGAVIFNYLLFVWVLHLEL